MGMFGNRYIQLNIITNVSHLAHCSVVTECVRMIAQISYQ